MSYILEALKKSERERQQSLPPDLYTVHGEAPAFQPASRRHPWLLFLAGLGTLAAILGGVYLWHSGGAADNSQALAPAPAPSTQVESVTLTETAANTPSARDEEPARGPAAGSASAEPAKVKSPIRATPIDEHPAGEPTATSAGAEPASRKVTVGSELPAFRFSGHTYSEESARRMIMVNTRIIKEGEWIDANTRLAEITWEGVILEHYGVQIKVKTQQN